MARHYVKCAICGQTFDRDSQPWVKISSRRYAHDYCVSAQEKEQIKAEHNREILDEYILQLLHLSAITPKIEKQIKTYTQEYHYTYTGIYKTLKYFYEIKGNSTDKAQDGIGIVPWTYDQANRYYYALWEAQQRNEDKEVKDYVPKEEVIRIPRPQRKNKIKRIFSFLDKEE